MAVVSAIDTGAQDFLDAVWPSGDLYIDDEEAFKKALGGGTYRSWWLLKPSVVRNIFSFGSRFGAATNDVTDKKTQLMGGTFVFKGGEVVHIHQETNTFDNGNARELLATVLGKDIADVASLPSTPAQAEVCTGNGK